MMNVLKLRELMSLIPQRFNDRPVYVCIEDEDGNPVENSDLLHSINEFVMDVEDDVVIIRGLAEGVPNA